ncbi:MAG: type 1 glutamine amidotransferase [Chitinispirillaceae bacterium]|jgi:GMP synthase (glutamine-hydrolysing)
MQVHYLQHEPFEDPGTILEWAAERGNPVSATMLYKGETLPSLGLFDTLVIMGGGMSVYEEDKYPWLAAEKRFIRRTIESGKAVLGICLGAQLIASALGARVYRHTHKEIGWFPVTLTPEGIKSELFKGWPARFPALQWHGDTFDIPANAIKTASSEGCANQAFVFGLRTLALQFHIESTAQSVERLLTDCKDEIVAGEPYIQSAEMIKNQKRYFPRIRRLLFRLLDALENCPAY